MTKYRTTHPRGVLVEGYRADKHPLYHTHANMLDRCFNETSTAFHNYGGRGITVCDSWRSFAQFVADMGPKPTPAHTIERKGNDGNYEPANCVWDTRTTQCVNRRKFSSNTSGTTGVRPTKSGKFRVMFDYEGERHNVGLYETEAEAILVRAAFVEGFLAGRGGLHRG